MILFWALLIAFATVGLCVIVHYEALRLTSLVIPRLTIPPRPKVLVVIAAVFLAHLAEIVIFAVTYRLMQPFPQLGEIAGHFSRSAVDYFYFSVTSFTTLGAVFSSSSSITPASVAISTAGSASGFTAAAMADGASVGKSPCTLTMMS